MLLYLKNIVPGGHIRRAIFNRCHQNERTPSDWKSSRAILIFKKGDPADLHNWIPIALSNTMGKLYAACVAIAGDCDPLATNFAANKIFARLKRSVGDDGISYKALAKADPNGHILRTIFNR